MRIIADGDLGLALVFRSRDDLETVIKHLKGVLDYKDSEAKKGLPTGEYPAGYAVCPDGLPETVAAEFVQRVKGVYR